MSEYEVKDKKNETEDDVRQECYNIIGKIGETDKYVGDTLKSMIDNDDLRKSLTICVGLLGNSAVNTALIGVCQAGKKLNKTPEQAGVKTIEVLVETLELAMSLFNKQSTDKQKIGFDVSNLEKMKES